MTAVTLTLTDFLLARIAEDESFALSAQVSSDEGGSVSWYWLRTNGTSNTWEPTLHDPARVLAECKAKRRIVEAHPEDYMAPDGRRLTVMDHWCWESGDPTPGCETTRALASIYADHPDYRSEWRP